MARFPAVALAVALAALSGGAAAQSGSSSSSSFPDIPLCDQNELIEVAEIMTTNARKLQCQSLLGVAEMVKVEDPLSLCSVPACVAALQVLYSTLPPCRYQDWPIQLQSELLLENCGIKPVNVTESSADGSFYFGSASADASAGDAGGPDPATTWNVSSSDGSSAFAPVGVTPSPSTAAPTPTPTPSSSASSVSASVVLAVVTASAAAVAL